MVEVRGKPLLGHIVAAYNAAGIKDITVVRGYRPEAVNLPALNYIDNLEFADTGELLSLDCALKAMDGKEEAAQGDLYISFGDVIFKRYILDGLAEQEADFVIAVDTDWSASVNRDRAADYVRCSEPYSRQTFYHDVTLAAAGEGFAEEEIHGEWMGVLRVSASGFAVFAELVSELAAQPEYRRAKIHHVLNELVQRKQQVRVVYTTGNWLDVDSLDDVLAAGSFA